MTSELETTAVKSPIPDWLNEQFFEDIFVEKHGLERGQFVVKVRAIIPTGGAGENYTSMLYRANVDAECGGDFSTRFSTNIVFPLLIGSCALVDGYGGGK